MYGYSNSLNPGNFEEFCMELTSSNSHHHQRRRLDQFRIAPKEATTEEKEEKKTTQGLIAVILTSRDREDCRKTEAAMSFSSTLS